MSNAMKLNTPPNGISDRSLESLDAEFSRMDKLLADPKCEHSQVLEQAFKIIQLMSRLLGKMDKKYVIEKEEELFVRVKKLKGTYNTKSVLALTVASAGITIVGGLLGMGAVLPGTSLATNIGSKAPNLLGWLSNAGSAKKLGEASHALSAVGQGAGGFNSLFNNSNEAARTDSQFQLEETKRKRSDREDAARQMRDQTNSAAGNCRQAIQAVHSAAQSLLSSRG